MKSLHKALALHEIILSSNSCEKFVTVWPGTYVILREEKSRWCLHQCFSISWLFRLSLFLFLSLSSINKDLPTSTSSNFFLWPTYLLVTITQQKLKCKQHNRLWHPPTEGQWSSTWQVLRQRRPLTSGASANMNHRQVTELHGPTILKYSLLGSIQSMFPRSACCWNDILWQITTPHKA